MADTKDLTKQPAQVAIEQRNQAISQAKMDKKKAIALLWYKGILSWKLKPVQLDLYNSYKNAKVKTIVWAASRRLGKSYALCTLAIETCIQKPHAIIKYIAPDQRHVKIIIKPIMREILDDCPPDLKPDFIASENIYRFPNGSEIQMAGTDNGRAENLRGGSSNLCIVDEAGFCDDLKYVVQSVLIPTTTTTHGKIILSSTPPRSPDHEFIEYARKAEYNGNFVRKTIYDAIGSTITEEMLLEILEEMGGKDNPEFRREYLAEFLTDEEITVVPEFTEEIQSRIIRDVNRPPFFDAYVAGDIGFKDYTVFLFGYYNFRDGKLIIEDELVMRGSSMNTELLAQKIKEKEKILWTSPITKEQKTPYLRVCDNNLIVINDLYKLHNLIFQPTEKDDKLAALNNMRILIKQGRILISPKCKTLIFHLKHGIWAKNKKTYARSPDAGHYDALDALSYMVRNVQFTKNPYPANYDLLSGENVWYGDNKKPLPPAFQKVKDMFTIKKTRFKINK